MIIVISLMEEKVLLSCCIILAHPLMEDLIPWKLRWV